MKEEVFRERAKKLQALLRPKKCGYSGPFIFAGPSENAAFFTVVGLEEKNSFRETIHVVWAGENGNLQQEEISDLIGFFKTSLDAEIKGNHILLNARCEDGDFARELNFKIPRGAIGEWCRKERPDKEIIIN